MRRIFTLFIVLLAVIDISAQMESPNMPLNWYPQLKGLAVGNLDNDQKVETVFGSSSLFYNDFNNNAVEGGKIYIMTWDNGSMTNLHIIQIPNEYGILNSAAIGDANGDGKKELLVHCMRGTGTWTDNGILMLYQFNAGSSSYQKIWETEADYRTYGNALRIADSDNDGANEIIIAAQFYGRKILIYEHNGSNSFSLSWETNGNDIASVDVGDLDGLPGNELLFGTNCWSWYDVRIYKNNAPNSYEMTWNHSGISNGYVSIGDIDRDGINEFATATYGGCSYPDDVGDINLYKKVNNSYNLIWSAGINHPQSMVLIGDVDNDGFNELASIGWDEPYQSGKPGIFKLRVYEWVNNALQLAFQMPLYTSNWFVDFGNLLVADINNDGAKELVICANAFYTLKGQFVSSTEGNKFTKDYLINDFNLEQNYPNPFNPHTVISYNISKSSQVTLKIYDINGTEIRTLVDAEQEVGIYQQTWDGKGSDGQPVASGTYFYQLRAGDFLQTKKMILIK